MARIKHITNIAAKPAVVLCASISLLAHAVLLGSLSAATPSGPAKPRTVSPASTLHVRTLTVARTERTAAVATPETPPDQTEPATLAIEDTATSDTQIASTPAEAPPPVNAATEPALEQTTLAHATAPGPTDQDGKSAYVPRPLLSMAPIPQGPVIIEPPVGETIASRHVGILSLFIDEEGRVHHIVPNEPRLPPMFERAAYDAFMAVRYTPGRLDGAPVKARIRVEVVFDNTLIAAQ